MLEREDIEAVIACLGDDAAQLRDENPENERADNMDRAATMLRELADSNSAIARLLLDQDREGAKGWARGLHINMDSEGGLTCGVTPCGNTPYDEGPFMLATDEHLARIAFLSSLSPEDMLEELLATIHGDGGHYSDEHGLAKATADAEARWHTCGVAAVRGPLTDDEILRISGNVQGGMRSNPVIEFARAIEAAHSISPAGVVETCYQTPCTEKRKP